MNLLPAVAIVYWIAESETSESLKAIGRGMVGKPRWSFEEARH